MGSKNNRNHCNRRGSNNLPSIMQQTKTKGQAGLEFLLLTGFMLAAFTLFFITIQEQNSEEIKEQARIEMITIAQTIKEEIELAKTTINGYTRTFNLPPARHIGTYTLHINESMLFIESEDGTYTYTTTTEEVTGQPIHGTNTIRKENETIYLNT
jgi:hypothetical protein